MSRLQRQVATAVCVLAGAFALPATITAAENLLVWTEPTVEEPWSGGRVWSVDTDFLDWVGERIPDGDRFLLIDGTGNVAIPQWAPYQLYPAVLTEDASEADWVVLYGIYRGNAGPEVEAFPVERVYSDGFSVLSRPGAPEDSGESPDGP